MSISHAGTVFNPALVKDPYAPVGGGEATANNSPLPTAATAQAGESRREQYKFFFK